MPYQLIELNTPATENLLCPHCQHAVIDWAEEQYIQPCEHTLFVAMDLGFEYASDVFEQSMPRSVDDIHAHDDQLDMWQELTSSSYPQYLIYKTDLGVQGLSRYVGFTVA
ncbi:MAG: hypothetical protein QMB80_03520 [Acinetobacter towneri]